MSRRTALTLFTACWAAACGGAAPSPEASTASAPRHRQLLVVVDGLRPDYVTEDVMPRLTALGRRGVVFTRHHSVYPTVTRVNASSIATGSYPERHGLLGNTVFFPSVDSARFLDTSDRGALLRVAEAEGHLLTAPTMGESLQAAGLRMLVTSSGSSGSAFLNNPTLAGGAILHYEYVLPESMAADMQVLGPAPADDAVDGSLDGYAIDAFLRVGLPKVDPSVTVIWLSDLDTAAHAHGMGSPEAVDTLRRVDAGLGRIEDALRDAGLLDTYDIWVTSDHGFSTYTGAVDLRAVLAPFMGTLADGTPRVVAGGGAIYVRDGDEAAVAGIVRALQWSTGVGAIFTAGASPDTLEGHVPGTLSFHAARWQHPRAAQILYSPDWTDAANAAGVRGTTSSNGVAGHGSSSPWDVHNTLIAAGPDLRQGQTVDVPTSNADLAPTFLTLLGLPVPPTMQGRVVEDGLAGDRPASRVVTDEHTVRREDGSYSVTAMISTVESGGREYTYFDGTRVTRILPPAASRPR
ncbi:MAG: alkaline phosphatase family protein [Vicinamibacterales bacterium]